jgi:hypothetical protein
MHLRLSGVSDSPTTAIAFPRQPKWLESALSTSEEKFATSTFPKSSATELLLPLKKIVLSKTLISETKMNFPLSVRT